MARAQTFGDKGGFAPNLRTADEATAYIMSSIVDAGYGLGSGVAILLDTASSEFFKDRSYAYMGKDESERSRSTLRI